MPQNPAYVFGEDCAPSLILKQDTSNDHQVLKAVLGDDPIGVAHEGTREAPIPGITSLAAKSGESQRIYGETEVCEVVVGTQAIVAGDNVAPDANSKAQPAVHNFPFVGKALADGAASGKVRIQVHRGIEDKSRTVLAKTQAASPYTVTLWDLGKVLTNTGATGAVEFDLPAAKVGYEVHARVDAAQSLRLDPNGTETITGTNGVPGAAGKYLEANAVNETVHLVCREDGKWDVESFTGTWTHEA